MPKLTFREDGDPSYRIGIRGLKGGHSAGRIHLERGNSIILAGIVMEALVSRFDDIRLADINGGMGGVYVRSNGKEGKGTVKITLPDQGLSSTVDLTVRA